MGNWEEIREGLLVQVEHLLMSERSGDVIVTECPKCNYQYPHIIGRPKTVGVVADYIIEQMNEYELKYQHEWAKKILAIHYDVFRAGLGLIPMPTNVPPDSVNKLAQEIHDGWMERQEELQKK